MIVILFFGILSPSLLHAGSITNETDFYNYLVSQGIKTVTRDGHAANYTTYKNYNLIVYGYPNDIGNNRTKYNSTTKTYEPEYYIHIW